MARSTHRRAGTAWRSRARSAASVASSVAAATARDPDPHPPSTARATAMRPTAPGIRVRFTSLRGALVRKLVDSRLRGNDGWSDNRVHGRWHYSRAGAESIRPIRTRMPRRAAASRSSGCRHNPAARVYNPRRAVIPPRAQRRAAVHGDRGNRSIRPRHDTPRACREHADGEATDPVREDLGQSRRRDRGRRHLSALRRPPPHPRGDDAATLRGAEAGRTPGAPPRRDHRGHRPQYRHRPQRRVSARTRSSRSTP